MKNYIIGFLLIGILVNVGFVFGENMGPEWKYKTGDVNSVSITPDGKYIVVGSDDWWIGDYIYLLNTNGDLLWKYEPDYNVDVSITPDGKYIVAGSRDDNVYFFNNLKYLEISGKLKTESDNLIKKAEDKINFLKLNGLSTKEAENLLNKAKTEFNKGNYKNAYDLATQSKNKIETQINNLINLANSKIKELQNLINKLNSQNIDTEELKTSLTNAKTKFNNKEYHLSLTTANQSVALANQILTAKQTIDNAKKLINQEKSKGNDVADAEDLLNNAEIEFQNKNYKKAENLAKQSLAKLSYIKELADLTKSNIEEANQSIIKAKSEGLDVKEPELLLSQAIKQYNLGNFEEAKKLAEQSKSKADDIYNIYQQQQLITYTKYGGLVLLILIVGIIITKGKSFLTGAPTIPEFPKELYKKYEPLEKIGEGGFAKVFKVKRKSDKKVIALKIPLQNKEAEKLFKKEVEAWKDLDHKNIVKMFSASEKPIPHIELEFIEGYILNGILIKDLSEYPTPLNELGAITITKQIAEGLKHAHSKNILHRDLKPNNVLLTNNKIPKITDFGLAKIGGKTTTTKGFTLAYAPPEVLNEEKTDKRTDIYQLGAIFYKLLTGKLTYEALTEDAMIKKILDENTQPIPPSQINPKFAKYDELFKKLLAKNKNDRYNNISEVLRILEDLEKYTKLKETLEKSLTLTTGLLEEYKGKLSLSVNKLIKLVRLSAKYDNKAEVINGLNELKYYINDKRLDKLIEGMEYRLKNNISITPIIGELNKFLSEIELEITKKLKSEKNELKQYIKSLNLHKKKLDITAIEPLINYAILCAELNDKKELIKTLEELLPFVKDKNNKKELKGAIQHIIALGNDDITETTKNMLCVILENVRKELKWK